MKAIPAFFTAVALASALHAGEGRIVKTLPHFLDAQGRHTIHPSLFERDGYQANLRAHPELCSGMRFDVQWKAHELANGKLKLEIRAANTPPRQMETFEHPLKKGALFSRWASIPIGSEDFKRLGSIIAW